MTALAGGAARFSVMLATSVAIRSPRNKQFQFGVSASATAKLEPLLPIEAQLLDASDAQRLGLLFLFLRGRVVHFHRRAVAQRAQDFVASGDDLVSRLQSVFYFDVGCAGDAGLHLAELGLLIVDHEDALDLFLV